MTAAGWLALLLLVAATLAFAALTPGRSGQPPRPGPAAAEAPAPRVSVIVPARDEARNVDRLLRSLRAQRYADFEVLVVDGGSVDGTRAVVAEHAAQDPRVRLLDEPPLPTGWVGKSWAAWTGRGAANGQWLLFTDADTAHAPESLGRAVAHAERSGAALLTGLTAQDLDSFGERVCMPPVFSLILAASGGPGHRTIGDPQRAIANGQFLLFRASAYDALSGHERVRGSIVEDLSLARLAASKGVPAAFVDLTELVSVRMYRGWREMFRGWRKNVATGASETPPTAWALTALTFAAGVGAEPAAAFAALLGDGAGAFFGAAAWAVGTVRVRASAMGAPGAGWRHAAMHPVGYAFFAAVLAASAWDRWTGRGPTWKGRRYAVPRRRS